MEFLKVLSWVFIGSSGVIHLVVADTIPCQTGKNMMQKIVPIAKKLSFFVWLAVLLYFMLLPGSASPSYIPRFQFSDKVYHFLIFLPGGYLGLHIARTFWNNRQSAMSAAVLSLSLLGILIELSQLFIPGRYCDIFDMTANICGCITGAFVGYYLEKRYEHGNKNTDK